MLTAHRPPPTPLLSHRCGCWCSCMWLSTVSAATLSASPTGRLLRQAQMPHDCPIPTRHATYRLALPMQSNGPVTVSILYGVRFFALPSPVLSTSRHRVWIITGFQSVSLHDGFCPWVEPVSVARDRPVSTEVSTDITRLLCGSQDPFSSALLMSGVDLGKGYCGHTSRGAVRLYQRPALTCQQSSRSHSCAPRFQLLPHRSSSTMAQFLTPSL